MNRIKHILLNWLGVTALNESMKALQWKVGIHRERIETINNGKARKSVIKELKEQIKELNIIQRELISAIDELNNNTNLTT